jgi:hypothetical protein
MHRLLTTALGLAFLSTSVVADEAKQAIDLSPQVKQHIVEEEYQSVRPGAMDERFERDEGVGGTNINLSYGEEEIEKDEYGLDRKIEGPAITDYSKPIDQGSRD